MNDIQDVNNNIYLRDTAAVEDTSIDVTNLIGHILIKWKVILIISVCTAAIGGAIGLYETHGKETTTSADNETLVEIAASKLTDEQIAEAETYYSQIKDYDRVIDERREYNSKAYIMSLNPQASAGYTLHYLVETDLDSASSLYSASILSEEDYKRIEDILDLEVINTDFDDTVSFELKEQWSSGDRETGMLPHKAILTVNLIAPDKNSCKEIAGIIDAAVIRRTDTLKEGGVINECILLDEEYDENTRKEIISAQQDLIKSLGDLITNRTNYINSVITKLDTDEQAYIDSLSEISSKGNGTDSETGDEPGKYFLRFTLIGLLAGCFISACWIVLRYMTGRRLHTAGELTEYYGLPVIQILNTTKSRSAYTNMDIITKWGFRLICTGEDVPDSLQLLFEELSDKGNKNRLGNTYLAVDRTSANAVEIARRIVMESPGDVTYSEGGLCPSPEDIKQLLDADSVIMLPVLDVTVITGITAFLDICRRNNKQVIGFVPVRDQNREGS